MSNTSKILSIVKSTKKIILDDENISSDNIIIIDLYNIYCRIIKFNKYKTFSRKTFILCIKLILKKFKNNQIIIISKNIFEVELDYIKNLTNNNNNILYYIIVEDSYHTRSQNRERDDYVALLYHLCFIKKNSFILTNDKYKNFNNLIDNIKPCKLHIYKKNNVDYIDIDNNNIKIFNQVLFENKCKLSTITFSFQ